MTSPPVRVRAMTLADCDRVSEIRVRGWQSAYRGLMPQPYLDALSVERDAERRRARFHESDDAVVNLVAEREGKVLGWAAYGPYQDGEVRTADAELYAVYVDPAHLGGGIGRALLSASAERCSAYPRMLLWVLKENTRARRFYERAGFRPDGAEEAVETGGVPVPEVRYSKALRG
ncbi:GNAT family N-acetyltransferase [Streptomyces sp. NK08204]|uniref:GNAT family N-acetyltransferase n=1 Tax=Streptomyces sp. NK08204 TaxID=2873260 RepID=UPI001CEC94FF|nr:GNAT family N-acetyltransferase [Streptomyces sp. NK08204]